MRLYTYDPMLLRQRIEQTLAYFFRDKSINERITRAVMDAVNDVLESKSEEVMKQIKIAEQGLRVTDNVEMWAASTKEGD